MATTKRRVTICLSKEDERVLNALSNLFEENNSQVIKRALTLLFYSRYIDKNEDKDSESS